MKNLNLLVSQKSGVFYLRPMGATIRMTKDRRILIRNTAEVAQSLYDVSIRIK